MMKLKQIYLKQAKLNQVARNITFTVSDLNHDGFVNPAELFMFNKWSVFFQYLTKDNTHMVY